MAGAAAGQGLSPAGSLMFDLVSILLGAVGGIVSVLGLTWTTIRARRKGDPFG
ncbi:hypothetical protein [Acetobacter sp.]|jgi:hypothetical protein|uniref:hypothetical protein n=1 Tax=Acetobacter sp. TaxID=440 RepID=UPI0025C192AB|nr:hypothetical protein [Acetobacter sp.]MCH4092050.1 hypothetical protein [Acetobacter sp.]MCI1317630.1 hypothetical protein [Acetobacter sp.]